MIISANAEKAFDKTQYPLLFFKVKTHNKLGTEGNLLNIIKAIHEKPTEMSYLMVQD